jgi:hypothetical protein
MANERVCAVVKKPLVGFNYPCAWNAYGLYFGGGNPPGSNAGLDVWTDNLKTNLIFLRDELNIGVVRIFLLCNAFNYGSVSAARRGFPAKFSLPPTMHPKFKEHIQKMLLAFRDTSMMVIPSIIDFKAIGSRSVLRPGSPARTVNGSRVPRVETITNGCTDRSEIVRVESIRNGFFQQIKENLLEPAIPFRHNIYAWEVENEPSWNFRLLQARSVAGSPTVSKDEMRTFLKQGVDLIDSIQFDGRPAFKSTVGHRFLEDLDDLPTGTRRQFHYYPFTLNPTDLLPDFVEDVIPPVVARSVDIPVRDRTLPRFNEANAFLGEIGVTDPSVGHGDLWPELGGSDAADTRVRVLTRLQLTRDKGYPLVMLWADGADGRGGQRGFPGPDPVHLSPDAQAGVKDFMKLP